MGYYAGRKEGVRLEAQQLSVLNYAFLDLCWDGQHGNPALGRLQPCQDIDGSAANPGDGSIVSDNPALDANHLARLAALRATNPKLKLLDSVGGWTRSKRFSDMAADARTRENFIASVVAFLRRHQFDGIDVDWEYPASIGVPCAPQYACQRQKDKENFIALARALRSALDGAGVSEGRRYLFTIAPGADREGRGGWLAELARSLDRINLMAYDYHGTRETSAGLVAPLHRDPGDRAGANVDETVTLYLEQAIPAAKLTLGEPFYGEGWAGCAPGTTAMGSTRPCQLCTGLASGSQEATFDCADLVDMGYLSTPKAATRWALGDSRAIGAVAREHRIPITQPPKSLSATTTRPRST